jgi:hypothetical protein
MTPRGVSIPGRDRLEPVPQPRFCGCNGERDCNKGMVNA